MGVKSRIVRALGRAAKAEVGIRIVIATTLLSLVAFALAIVLGFQQPLRTANALDQEHERHLASNYVALAGQASVAQQSVQLTWDEGFRAAGIGRDFVWADTYLGEFLWTGFRYDRLYLVDPRGSLLRAWSQGKPAPEADFAAAAPVVRRQMENIATRGAMLGKPAEHRQLADTRWPFDSSGRPLTRYATTLVTLEGRPAILTVASLLPDKDYALLTRAPNFLVSIRRMDDAYLAEMSAAILLPDMTFSARDRAMGPINSLALTGFGGDRLGWLSWKSVSHGDIIAKRYGPVFVAFFCFLLAVICGGYFIVRALLRAMTSLKVREAQAHHEAHHDGMTGLPNRATFNRQLSATLERLESDPQAAVVVGYFDLDNFKYINDTRGHHFGDALLVQVANRCRLRFGDETAIARFGGDEFVVLRTFRTSERGAAIIGEEIMAIFAAPFLVADEEIDITASCGISWGPQNGRDPDELLRQADIALNDAKQRGRARWRAFQPQMKEAVQQRHDIEIGLRRAIANDELRVAYQPIVRASDGHVTSVESLLRWNHPQFGEISPAVFVPIAEQAGLMSSLGWWLLGRVMAERLMWPQIALSINLSPVQLMARNFADELRELCLETGVSRSQITLEITEGMLLQRGDGVFDRLARLQKMGFRIALDDFGTGYSSLSYLRAFHFDCIKIDRCFVQDIENDLEARSIFQTIVSLGHAIDTQIVAEGVETAFQRELVVAAGCDFIQGHFYWPALNAGEICELLSAQRAPTILRKAS